MRRLLVRAWREVVVWWYLLRAHTYRRAVEHHRAMMRRCDDRERELRVRAWEVERRNYDDSRRA